MKKREPSLNPCDRISMLPDCLLVHGLSLLSLDEIPEQASFRGDSRIYGAIFLISISPLILRSRLPFSRSSTSCSHFTWHITYADSALPSSTKTSHKSSVYSWIRFKFGRHVQELELVLCPLDISTPMLSLTLPYCTSLKSVKLQYFDINLVELPWFQSLELVSLSYVSCDGAVIGDLIPGSPRLAILDIGRCEVKGDLDIIDSRGQLEWQRVGLCSDKGVLDSKVEIAAPNH